MATPNPLSPESAAEIDRMARSISVANHLDPEIQSELRSHLEEKMLNYLSGRERPSQADALLLTRAHFGNPATLKALFQETHAIAHSVSLFRRLVAAITITVITHAVLSNLFIFFFHVAFDPARTISPRLLDAFVLSSYLLYSALYILCLWSIFAYWRRGMARGKKYWFETWSIYTLLLIVPTFWLAKQFSFGHVFIWGPSTHDVHVSDLSSLTLAVTGWLQLLTFGSVTVFLWFWWCDRVPHSWRTLLYTFLLFFAFYHLDTFFTMFRLYRFSGSDPQVQAIIISSYATLAGQRILFALLALGIYLAYRYRKQIMLEWRQYT